MTEKLLGFWFNDEEGFGDGAAILQRLSQTRRDGFALAVKNQRDIFAGFD
jgi:hypothetical protein